MKKIKITLSLSVQELVELEVATRINLEAYLQNEGENKVAEKRAAKLNELFRAIRATEAV